MSPSSSDSELALKSSESKSDIQSNHVRPTFINIGPGRCATSWLLEALKAHPEIEMSKVKETEYFNTHFQRDTDWYHSHSQIRPTLSARFQTTITWIPLLPSGSRITIRRFD